MLVAVAVVGNIGGGGDDEVLVVVEVETAIA